MAAGYIVVSHGGILILATGFVAVQKEQTFCRHNVGIPTCEQVREKEKRIVKKSSIQMETEYILNDTLIIRVTVVFVNSYINLSGFNTIFASSDVNFSRIQLINRKKFTFFFFTFETEEPQLMSADSSPSASTHS